MRASPYPLGGNLRGHTYKYIVFCMYDKEGVKGDSSPCESLKCLHFSNLAYPRGVGYSYYIGTVGEDVKAVLPLLRPSSSSPTPQLAGGVGDTSTVLRKSPSIPNNPFQNIPNKFPSTIIPKKDITFLLLIAFP